LAPPFFDLNASREFTNSRPEALLYDINIAGARLDKIFSAARFVLNTKSILHPAGVRLPLTSPSTNMSPRWGATTTYFTFYKYVTPPG